MMTAAMDDTASPTRDKGDRGMGFRANATLGESGRNIQIMARVSNADAAAGFSASAVVRFASREANIELERVQERHIARARVPVDAPDLAGPVTVVVTMDLGDSSAVLTFPADLSPAKEPAGGISTG